jgi:hypothetical protein
MSTCPSCTALLPERGFFCAACAAQIRCKACHEPLEPDARACVMCGASVGSDSPNQAVDGNTTRPINTFELQEDLRSRTVRLQLTDHAVAHVGEALTAVFADRITGKPRPARQVIHQLDSPHALLAPATEQDPAQTDPAASAEPTAPVGNNQVPGDDRQRLREIFELVDDDFRLEEDDLKADSCLEYARRLTYLYIYAHELEGRKPIPYANVKKILQAAKVLDTNTRRELANKMAVEIGDDSIRLKKGGRQKAIEALDQILDPNHTTPGWTPESRTRPPKPGAEAKAAKSAAARPGRKRSKQAEEWAAKWETHPDHVNGHFILKGKGLLDKAAMALWAVSKVGGTVASQRYISRFISAAFSYTENEESIRAALERDKGKELAIKVKGGYKLTPTGVEHVKQLLKAAPKS